MQWKWLYLPCYLWNEKNMQVIATKKDCIMVKRFYLFDVFHLCKKLQIEKIAPLSMLAHSKSLRALAWQSKKY